MPKRSTLRLLENPYNSNKVDLYKEPEIFKKVGFQAPDLGPIRSLKIPRSLFFQGSENAKKAHINAPDIAKLVDGLFIVVGVL